LRKWIAVVLWPARSASKITACEAILLQIIANRIKLLQTDHKSINHELHEIHEKQRGIFAYFVRFAANAFCLFCWQKIDEPTILEPARKANVAALSANVALYISVLN
jgi:hypothetical protein